nr:MAG TPA_asm: hypothetical protein [Caudoviricetes sp.]
MIQSGIIMYKLRFLIPFSALVLTGIKYHNI